MMGQTTMILLPLGETDRVKIIAMPDALKLHFGWVSLKGFETTRIETLAYSEHPEMKYIVNGEDDNAAWNVTLLDDLRGMCWDDTTYTLTAGGRALLEDLHLIEAIGRAITEKHFIPATATVNGKAAFTVYDKDCGECMALIMDSIEAGLMVWDNNAQVYVLTYDNDQPTEEFEPQEAAV